MRAEHDVLLVPGDHFELPNHIRFGFGEELHHFREALAETERGLKRVRSEEHTSELQSHHDLVCRLLLEKKKNRIHVSTPGKDRILDLHRATRGLAQS